MTCSCCLQVPEKLDGRCVACHIHCPNVQCTSNFEKSFLGLLILANHNRFAYLRDLGLCAARHFDLDDERRALGIIQEAKELDQK